MSSAIGIVLGLLAILALIAMNGFFVAAEFSLVSVRKTQIEHLAQGGSRRARRVLRALEHLDTYIAATQLGVTMASLALGFVAEPTIARLFEPGLKMIPFLRGGATATAHGIAFVLAFVIATALHIVFGELAPKSLALRSPDQTSLLVTPPLNLFLRVFKPFILALNATGNGVVRLMGMQPVSEHEAAPSKDELEILVHSTAEAGLLEAQQERMVSGIFGFEETIVRKIMTPRLDITAVDVNGKAQHLVQVVTDSGHSRLPVYEESLDNIIGVIHIKDVLKDLSDGAIDADIRGLMRPPFFVPETKKAGFLLSELRRSKTHLALVRDEYGLISGVVTMEDLIEEIVGDILDEYDVEDESLLELEHNVWMVEGRMALEEFNERVSPKAPLTGADTLGGFVFSLLGHQPTPGETVSHEGIEFRVEETDGRRVQKVRVIKSALTPINLADDEEDDDGLNLPSRPAPAAS